jgi:hypothetical protein
MTKIHIQEDDYDFILAEHRRRLHDDLTGAVKPGKKIKILTTNTPTPAVEPEAESESRPDPVKETLREKYCRLKRKMEEVSHEKRESSKNE